jgi:hypothetical protein
LEKEKDDKIVEEVMKVCKDLGIEINPTPPVNDDSFLGAWRKKKAM